MPRVGLLGEAIHFDDSHVILNAVKDPSTEKVRILRS